MSESLRPVGFWRDLRNLIQSDELMRLGIRPLLNAIRLEIAKKLISKPKEKHSSSTFLMENEEKSPRDSRAYYRGRINGGSPR